MRFIKMVKSIKNYTSCSFALKGWGCEMLILNIAIMQFIALFWVHCIIVGLVQENVLKFEEWHCSVKNL